MLKELTKESVVEGLTVLIEDKKEAVTKNGKPYLNLVVRDKGGSIQARLWDYNSEKHKAAKTGGTAQIWATVEEFNGNLQLNVKAIEESLEDPTSFYKHTRFNVEDMWAELVKLVGTFDEPMTKFVTEEILLKHAMFSDAFKKAPAAKVVHNAWYGGLLEHVISLTRMAEPLITHYQTRYCKKMSRDKVMFGLIMHDAGKIIEYDYSKPSFDKTGIGILTNHMVLGPAWIYEKANQFIQSSATAATKPEQLTFWKFERAHLMHILAAHHGQIEWGSPVTPASLEAVLVHHLDNLDAKMLHAVELIEGKTGQVPGFSERSYFEKTEFLQYE